MEVFKFGLVVCVIALVESATKETEATVESTLKALVTRVETLEDVIAEQAETISQQAELIKKLRSEERSRTARKTAAPVIAFTAFLDKVVTNPVPNKPIPFNRVLINEGRGYNVNTGKFQTSQDGLYMFTFGIESDAAGHIVTKLVVNGANQVNAVNGQYQNSGNTAVVRLTTGQEVWVAIDGGNATIWNSDTYRYSTFSGVYLA